MPATDTTDTDPSVTSRTTTVSTTRPMTSSATAAPSTMRASVVASARRSPKTRAVMPTLVAVSAAPTNSDVLKSKPISSIAPMPSTIGAITPAVATSSDARPTALELRQIHLEPDLEQQQDDADLAERAQRLVGRADEAEHRRADHDAGEDLADDRGHTDALGAFRRELRRDEHDEDVEEDGADVHGSVFRSRIRSNEAAAGT